MTTRREHRRRMESGIFDAAIRLFDEQGYDATSVEEICAEAGVGRATFFRYFETKGGLIREYDRRVAGRMRERIGALDDPTFARSLRAIGDVICEAWTDSGPGLRALGAESPTLPRPTRRVFAHALDVVHEVVVAHVNTDFRTTLPTPLAAYVITVQLLGPIGWWIDNPGTDLRTLIDGVLQHCLDGYPAPVNTPHH